MSDPFTTESKQGVPATEATRKALNDKFMTLFDNPEIYGDFLKDIRSGSGGFVDFITKNREFYSVQIDPRLLSRSLTILGLSEDRKGLSEKVYTIDQRLQFSTRTRTISASDTTGVLEGLQNIEELTDTELLQRFLTLRGDLENQSLAGQVDKTEGLVPGTENQAQETIRAIESLVGQVPTKRGLF